MAWAIMRDDGAVMQRPNRESFLGLWGFGNADFVFEDKADADDEARFRGYLGTKCRVVRIEETELEIVGRA